MTGKANRKFLSLEERETIERFLSEGLSVSAIAHIMKRPPSTIGFEVKKNSKDGVYTAAVAHVLTRARISKRAESASFPPSAVKLLEQGINSGWSIKKIADISGIAQFSVKKYIDLKKENQEKEMRNSLEMRIAALEQQIKILFEIIKEKHVKGS